MIDQVGKDSIMRASPHLDESKKELCMLATRTLITDLSDIKELCFFLVISERTVSRRCQTMASRKFGLVANQKAKEQVLQDKYVEARFNLS